LSHNKSLSNQNHVDDLDFDRVSACIYVHTSGYTITGARRQGQDGAVALPWKFGS